MDEFDEFYNELVNYLREIEERFVSNISPLAPPDNYELDVRAYCILSHAAFEEYFEQIALTVMHKSFQNWLQPTQKLNDTLLTLIAYSDEKIDYENPPFSNVKKILEKAIRTLSKEITVQNHGISHVHLPKILLPVSLQISDDENLRNSLTQLVQNRGAFAHKGKIKNVLSPEDAKGYVEDCIKLCKDIKEKAQAKFI